jgi:carbon storage regulator
MLILSRKINESIVIDGRITVKIVRIDRDVVKLGILAPADVPVHRQEVYEEIRRSNEEAVSQATATVPQLSGGAGKTGQTPPMNGGHPVPERPNNPKPK